MKLLYLRIVTTVTVIFSLSFSVFGQTDNSLYDFSELRRSHYESFSDISKVEGQVFFKDEWLDGQVFFNTKYATKNISIKYFVKGAQMLINKDGEVLAISNPQTMDSIIVGEHTFIYTKLLYGSKVKDDFMELLEKGSKLKLLKHYTCRFIKGKEVSSYTSPDPDRFLIKHEYYAQEDKDVAKFIKVNKKSILTLMSNQREKVQMFIKKNKLRLGKEKDLIRIFDYYNRLI